jgi:tyrosyl-tRNA synthetase
LAKTIVDILAERGFIEQITDTGLQDAAATQSLKCYVGFDPTARSLHLGHVIPVMGLAHFQRMGQDRRAATPFQRRCGRQRAAAAGAVI